MSVAFAIYFADAIYLLVLLGTIEPALRVRKELRGRKAELAEAADFDRVMQNG